MKMIKESKTFSSLLILFVYISATVLGLFLYKILNFNLLINLLVVDCLSTIYVFLWGLVFNNASVYDPYWSVLPVVVMGAYLFSNEFNLVNLLLFIVIFIWGLRLTLNWLYTFPNLYKQDWRYQMLKEKCGKLYPLINLFGIHLFPTIVVYLCIIPAVVLVNSNTSFSVFIVIGALICLIAISLELISDVTMHKFRKKQTHTLIRDGIWKYSRHPNYLGEILMWFGVLIFSIDALKNNLLLIIGPFINLLMFLFISIPMAEKRQSKKEDFDQYKKETRMLLPIPKIKKDLKEIKD